MTGKSNYEKRPIAATGPPSAAHVGIDRVARALAATRAPTIAIEAYPGVHVAALSALACATGADVVIDTNVALRAPADIEAMVAADLGDDPVFGRVTSRTLRDFFDPARLAGAREAAQRAIDAGQRVVVVGVGATFVLPDPALLVVADLPRWEAQRRQRAGEGDGIGGNVRGLRASLRYKRSFFVEWRVADAHKWPLLARADFVLDTVDDDRPVLVDGAAVRRALASAASAPFRVVPFFDPAPWGGHWMEDVCDLDRTAPNHGWCFDCVPEENSLLLGFGDHLIELPALDLIRPHGPEVLGRSVHERFEGEFPIRFDFLDTMGGGNLSLQVHPLEEYLQSRFGAGSGRGWTQHESYYLLDAGADATVYLGLRDGADVDAMFCDLASAQRDSAPTFDAQRYVNRWPARRHDHFLIPAGTVHCSGANSMVLEISATPFLFTFKLWDWGRLGLDGMPRPVHLDHGRANVDVERTTAWVERELINRVEPLACGDGWRSERTGLHALEPIDTVRHWVRPGGCAPHDDVAGSVRVLNLVEGGAAVVESPDNAWDPYVVHYAETFILPDAAGPFTVRPHGDGATDRNGDGIGDGIATIRATVRP
jgi:hypothetical protein